MQPLNRGLIVAVAMWQVQGSELAGHYRATRKRDPLHQRANPEKVALSNEK